MAYTFSMRFSPYLHALAAAAYIWGIGSLLFYISSLHHDTPDTFVAPIVALSLFVFSAAVMAFLFFYRPVVLLIEHKREEAFLFFLKTLGTFGLLTVLVVLTIL